MTAPALPQVGDRLRITGKVIAIETYQAPPPPPVVEYVFEVKTWRIESRINGRLVNEICTMNDWYGAESLDAAIHEAKKEDAKYGAGLEIVVVEQTHCARRTAIEHMQDLYNPPFCKFTDTYDRRSEDIPKSTEKEVWSSKRGAP